jgi:pimeloyl-ACP methyl ester carboxylesterase
MRSSVAGTVALALLFCLASCAGPATSGTPSVPGSPSPSTSVPAVASAGAGSPGPTTSLPPELHDSEAVAFRSLDGVSLDGRVFGSGEAAVVLVHGSVDDAQASWYPFARQLADAGYLAMTIDLRGFCPGGLDGCSDGKLVPPDTWQDVAGAVEYLRGTGVAKVFVVGASLGARSCLWAASRPSVVLDGVVGVSTPEHAATAYQPEYDFTATVVGSIDVPILFMAGDQDQNYAAEAREMYGWSNEPKELVILGSAVHGAGLLQDPKASAAVLSFLHEHD